jgi:hypothetical protein
MIGARRAAFAGALSLVLGAGFLPACSPSADAGPSCENATKDDGEDGVDCGGVCPKKCTAAGCAANEECGSGKCESATCSAPAGKTCGVGAPVPTCADGEKCELDKDCASGFCDGATCATPAAGSHSDGQKNGGETGVDCGGNVKTTQPCPDGQGCLESADCVGTCTAGLCGPISHTDGKKNLDETDVDCGGTAPKCADGKGCAADADCTTGYCPADKKVCVAPTYDDGVKNGTETDVDCGGTGTGMKKCAENKTCLADPDCIGACKTFGAAKKCIDAPSCKGHFGGDTCGTNEIGSGAESHLGPGGTVLPQHESCCRTLPVKNYSDPLMPGKTVYVDKYEITAGRMRAFLEAIGGGVDAAGNAKSPDVKGYMAAHRPSRWNNGWENVLPANNAGSQATYVVAYGSGDGQYPGQDQYIANHPTQTTWWIRSTGATATAKQGPGQQGTYTVETGLFYALGTYPMFPEYYADPNVWKNPGEGEGYAVNHALNCSNDHGAYGWSTYWFDDATVATYNGFKKAFGANAAESKAIHDVKSMNCAPNALFAAFCAWDGGQLATAEVMDAITDNTASPIFDDGNDPSCQGTPTRAACQGGKLLPGKSGSQPGTNPPTPLCAGNTLNTFPDGTQGCYNVYYYPGDDNDYDGSSKIAPPGRIIADAVTKVAGDEPWMDMIGNLQEAVLKKSETVRFDYRGYGVEWSSIQHHHNQQSTARGKGGAFGARCMRFK